MPLVDVDAARETFDHHCQSCRTTTRGLKLRVHMSAHTDLGQGPGASVLRVDCETCGTRECFNTDLGLGDEDERASAYNYAWRAQQARIIRAAMRFHGLPTRERSA